MQRYSKWDASSVKVQKEDCMHCKDTERGMYVLQRYRKWDVCTAKIPKVGCMHCRGTENGLHIAQVQKVDFYTVDVQK